MIAVMAVGVAHGALRARTADTSPPSAPKNLRVSAKTSTSISLRWDASRDNVRVTGYRLWVGTTARTTTSTSIVVDALACGVTYSMRLAAYDAAGNLSRAVSLSAATSACAADTTPPTAPAPLLQQGATTDSVTIDWGASSDDRGVAGYIASVDGGSTQQTNALAATFVNLQCSTSHTVRVVAVDFAGNRSQAAAIDGSTAGCRDSSPPTSPAPTVSGVTATGFTVGWAPSTDDTGVTGYAVTVGSAAPVNVVGTSFIATALLCGTSYPISVSAFDAAGNLSAPGLATGSTGACSSSSGSTGTNDATVFLSPSGSDAAACSTSSPCRSLQRGLAVADDGAVVELAPGSYAGQQLTGGRAGLVTFRPAAGGAVLFTGRLRLASLRNVALRDIQVSHDVPDAGIEFICTAGVRLDRAVAKGFAIFEGNKDLTISGGSFGGYNTPSVEEDSVIGSTDSQTCGTGSMGPDSQIVVLDGVTFHDSFWPVSSRSDFGTAHPDCFQFMGNVNGMVIRNSTFIRCGDSFIGMYPDTGHIRNVTIENNLFRDLGGFTYYGIQMGSDGHPFTCTGVTFRGNTYEPNNPTSLTPYSPLRSQCASVSGQPASVVTGNTFQTGPGSYACSVYQASPYGWTWDRNRFTVGSPCGTNAS
jgi:chitodextrinase